MHKIRDWLYIGGYRDTADLDLLQTAGVGSMLQLADHRPQPGIATLPIIIDDGVPVSADKLALGIAYVRGEKALGKSVLVACGAGISRSTTFAIGVLKEEEGGTVLETFLNIRKHHPNALPHISLWHSLCQYYGEDTLYQEIWQHLRK
ncbi:MAG: dual specificity protein phosphatase family protein [Phototrophicaceae bacterium]|jgi:protein-tyrosine phosphatase